MRGRAPFLAALALQVAVLGCQSNPPVPPTTAVPNATTGPNGTAGPTTPAGPTTAVEVPATPDEAACQQAIAALDLADPASISAVAGCRFTPGGETAAQQVLAAGGTRDQLWGALWVYATSSRDPAPLLPLAANPDPSIRAMAGAALAPLGEHAGIDALAASLNETSILAGSNPPEAIDEFAVFSLSRSVVAGGAPSSVTPSGPPSSASPASSAGPSPTPSDPIHAWQDWLTAHSAQLVFDSTARQWSLP
jgi:hypothetical protein